MYRRAVAFGEGRPRQEDSQVVNLIGVLEQEDEVCLVAGSASSSGVTRQPTSAGDSFACCQLGNYERLALAWEESYSHQSARDNGSEHAGCESRETRRSCRG